MDKILLALGYVWALPHTIVGFVLMLWYIPHRVEWRDGCLECIISRDQLIGGKWVGAQTHGWIIFYRDAEQQARGDLSVHERVHVKQGWIGGPLYIIAYGVHFLWNWQAKRMHWQDAYRNIWFEKAAYKEQAEYKDSKAKPAYWGHR
jgi:hypothetical protein